MKTQYSLILLLLQMTWVANLSAQTTAFTYQGQLAANGSPASGIFHLQFSIYDSSAGPTLVAGPQTNAAVAVSNGLFTVTLDFGAGVFDGNDRWLEIGVRTNGAGVFETLAPRQPIAPTPYSQRSATAGTADSAATANTAVSVSAGGVGSAALQPGAVTTTALSDGAVTAAKIGGVLNPASIPDLDAAKINTGTLSDARLSSNVALVNADNAFAGSNQFSGVLHATNTANQINGTFTGNLAGNLTGNATTADGFTGALVGDVTGTQGSTVVATVGGESAASIGSATSLANAATDANTPGAVVRRDGSGNFTAGTITANLAGNAATATSATTAGSFSGPLLGDVTGTQGATVVSSVGGQGASSVAGGVSAANAATSANTPDTIVKRDGGGGFSAGAIAAASLAGDGAGLTNLNGAGITTGTVGNAQLAANAVQGANIAAGAVGTTQLASGAVTSNNLASGAASANLFAGGQSPVPSGGMILSTNPMDASLLAAGYVKLGKVFLNDGWEERSTNGAPSPRFQHCAVWTGSEMILWGGWSAGSPLNDGVRYDPTTDTWTPISTNGAPSPRYAATAHWTGSKMIIWGGAPTTTTTTNDGAIYDPALDSWTPMSNVGSPAPRSFGAAANAWTGSEFIVWGGFNGINTLATGARYHLATDTWTNITASGAPSARRDIIFTWSGTELLIYGGYSGSSALGNGFRYNPTLDSWSTMTATGSPGSRRTYDDIAVWTGSEMVFWGGINASDGSEVNSGARYNPASNSWTLMSTQDAPVSRYIGSAVGAGSEYIYWGGRRSSPTTYYRDGGRYDVDTDAWTPMTLIAAPSARNYHTMIWTGNQLLMFGGTDGATTFGDLWAYTPPKEFHLYQRQ